MDDVSIIVGMIIAFFGLTAWYLNRAFTSMDKRFEAIDKKFEAIDKKFDDFRSEQNKRLDDFKDFFKELF